MSTLLANGTCRPCGARVHVAPLPSDGRRIRINLRPVKRGALTVDVKGDARFVGPVEAAGLLTYEPHAFTCKARPKEAPSNRLTPSLLDEDEAFAAKTEGMTRAEMAADEAWRDRAVLTVRDLALSLDEFTSDDVWGSGLEKPREPRVLGSVMEEAAKRGWIRRTGRSVPSAQVSRHNAPVAVWASLLRT